MPHPQPQPYDWHLTASRRYQGVFLAVNALLVIGLFSALDFPLAAIAAALLLLLTGALYKRHHALGGASLGLRFNSTGFSELVSLADGSVEARPFCLHSCRWLGRNCLVAHGARPQTKRRILAHKSRYVLLVADNSTAADRHRLAMYYQLGLLS